MVTLASLLNPLFTRAHSKFALPTSYANPRTVHRTLGSHRILFPSPLLAPILPLRVFHDVLLDIYHFPS